MNLELTHPGATELIGKGVIGAARSLIPGSLSAVDRTMEETFMKFAKGSGTVKYIFILNHSTCFFFLFFLCCCFWEEGLIYVSVCDTS